MKQKLKQTLKIKRSIDLNGTIVPKGTELSFSTEGVAYFKGKKVEKALIPLVALESFDTKVKVGDKVSVISTTPKRDGFHDEIIDVGSLKEISTFAKVKDKILEQNDWWADMDEDDMPSGKETCWLIGKTWYAPDDMLTVIKMRSGDKIGNKDIRQH